MVGKPEKGEKEEERKGELREALDRGERSP